jgi:hypothetical protein
LNLRPLGYESGEVRQVPATFTEVRQLPDPAGVRQTPTVPRVATDGTSQPSIRHEAHRPRVDGHIQSVRVRLVTARSANILPTNDLEAHLLISEVSL